MYEELYKSIEKPKLKTKKATKEYYFTVIKFYFYFLNLTYHLNRILEQEGYLKSVRTKIIANDLINFGGEHPVKEYEFYLSSLYSLVEKQENANMQELALNGIASQAKHLIPIIKDNNKKDSEKLLNKVSKELTTLYYN